MKIARSLSSLSKNYRFSDNLCFDFAEHESTESSRSETFSLWEKRKGTPSVPFAPEARNLLPHFAFGKTGRTGAPQCAA